MKDLSKVPKWQLECNSNLRPSGHKAPNLPMSRHAPRMSYVTLRYHLRDFEEAEDLSLSLYALATSVHLSGLVSSALQIDF